MNTFNLTQAVAEKTGLSQTEAKKALVATIDTITAAVCKGNKVRLVGFGTFEQIRRKARLGFNPKTKKPIKIGASKLPKFRPGKAFKDIVKKSRPGRSGETVTAKTTVPVKKTAKVVKQKVTVKRAVTKTAARSKPVTSVLGRKPRTAKVAKTTRGKVKAKTTSRLS